MDKLLNDIAPASTTDVAEEKTVDAGTEIAPGAEAAPESDPVTLGGTAVSPGAAFGHAQMFAEGELEIPHFTIEKTQTRAEFTRLRAAVHTVDKEFGELIAELNREEDAPTEAIAFLELHRQLLNDDSIISETQDIIRERLINAEWALSLKLEDIRRSFEEIDDDYLADRIDDIAQVIERVQRVLSGRRRPADTVSRMMSESSVILVAEDFSPADILILKRRQDISITGLIIEKGAATSHSSILARSLEIPTLVNVSNACEVIQTDDVLLMDADKGIVIVNPQKDGMPQMSERIRKMNAVRLRQRKLKATHCVTADGCAVSLLANLALPEDAKEAMSNGADGVGLFRSEFLFMNRPNFPSEDEQFETYTRVVKAMRGKIVTIRTMDLGGDKLPSREALESIGEDPDKPVANPSLGRRAIRFSLSHTDVFLTQLRAILRAGATGRVRLLVPMLSWITEADIVLSYVRRAQEELKDRGVKYAENIQIGGMVEVPSAALCLKQFLKRLDFVSVGTNDLIQYLLAVDREDPDVGYLYDPLHPAVLSMLYNCINTAHRAGKEISVCGEAAADPVFAFLLLGMGLRHFSMESARLLPIKEFMLASVPDPFVPMEADQLDGFLTALCLLKVPPSIDDWFIYVLDASGNRRAKLADPAEHAELRRLVLARGADIESRILHEKPVDPIIYDEDIDEDDPEGELAALAPFADGFAFACSLWPELMKSQNKAIQAALVGILRHESPDEEDAEEEAEADDATAEVRFANLDEALEDVEACVQEIAEVTRKDDIKKAPAKKPAFAKKRR